MRRRVVGADAVAPLDIDGEGGLGAGAHDAALDHAVVHDQVAARLRGVAHLDEKTVALDGAGVAHLPARFAVEGRARGDDRDVVPFGHRLDRLLTDELYDLRRRGGGLVAEELGWADLGAN